MKAKLFSSLDDFKMERKTLNHWIWKQLNTLTLGTGSHEAQRSDPEAIQRRLLHFRVLEIPLR